MEINQELEEYHDEFKKLVLEIYELTGGIVTDSHQNASNTKARGLFLLIIDSKYGIFNKNSELYSNINPTTISQYMGRSRTYLYSHFRNYKELLLVNRELNIMYRKLIRDNLNLYKELLSLHENKVKELKTLIYEYS